MVQKGLKMHEKRQKNRVFGPKIKRLLFSGIFLSGIGGYPLPPVPPLTENHPAQNP